MQISPSLIDDRYRAVRRAMKEAGYRVLLVVGNSEVNQRGFFRYVSDWRLFGGTGYVVFSLEEDPVMVMGLGAQAEWAKERSAISDTRAFLDKNSGLVDVLKGKGLEAERIGCVGWNRILPTGDAQQIAQALPNAQFEDVTPLMEGVMKTLFPEEIAHAEETHSVVVRVLERIASALEPGRTERDVLAEGIHEAARYGCLDGMVHIGTGLASKTMPGTDRKIEETDILKFFLEFAGPSGFLIELGGTFSFGAPPERQLRKFETDVKAMERAAALMKPGTEVRALCEVIQETFEQDGWILSGRRLWDFHGQGLNSILPPLGMPDSREELTENSMINIHPGILTEDGIGVSATHNYLVTADGGRALGGFKPEWQVLNP